MGDRGNEPYMVANMAVHSDCVEVLDYMFDNDLWEEIADEAGKLLYQAECGEESLRYDLGGWIDGKYAPNCEQWLEDHGAVHAPSRAEAKRRKVRARQRVVETEAEYQAEQNAELKLAKKAKHAAAVQRYKQAKEAC